MSPALAPPPAARGETSSAAAQSGGTPQSTPTGGTRYGQPVPDDTAARDRAAKRREAERRAAERRAAERRKAARLRDARRRRLARRPVLESLTIGSRRLFEEGRPIAVSFRLRSPARTLATKLVVRVRGGGRVAAIDLGDRATGKTHTYLLTDVAAGRPPEGVLELRIVARDRRRRPAVRGSSVPAWTAFNYATHRFPVVGDFDLGGDDARFGAPRTGHSHKGQDISADEGTPIVAPHGGTVTVVAFQAEGAGNYVVLDSAGEDRDYVFMHMQDGSVGVTQGQQIPTGKLIGRVGNTGRSFGAHLHFEIWTDGHWFDGGKPTDPRPIIDAWLAAAR